MRFHPLEIALEWKDMEAYCMYWEHRTTLTAHQENERKLGILKRFALLPHALDGYDGDMVDL